MEKDSNTINDIEYNNYISGVANLLTKYGFASVWCEDINTFLLALEERFGIKAMVDESRAFLKRGEYFLKIL